MVPLYEGLAEVVRLGVPARRSGIATALNTLPDDVETVVKVLLAVVAWKCGVEIGVAAFDPVLYFETVSRTEFFFYVLCTTGVGRGRIKRRHVDVPCSAVRGRRARR